MTGSLIAAENAPAPASPAIQHGNLDRKDHEFLKKAAEINLTEIELGKIAERAQAVYWLNPMPEADWSQGD